MPPKVIPQRQLRNQIGQVLREAEAGQTFTITVRGRAVATLGPAPVERRVDVDARTVADILSTPIDSEDLAAELDAAEAPVT
jgi:prevent-host-death family protein